MTLQGQARQLALVCVLVSLGAPTPTAVSYPLDGYESTGIRRLLAYRRVVAGELKAGFRLQPGATQPMAAIRLRLRGVNDDYDPRPGTAVDASLQSALASLFASRDPSYRLAVVDITDPTTPRFASLRPDEGYIPGSVGKLLVMVGLFAELQKRFPANVLAREKVLRSVEVVADGFAMPNSHEVPIVDGATGAIAHRAIRSGDRFTLWEWLDHMVSPSSNAAGSIVWREALLMSEFGGDYPPAPEVAARFFAETPKRELSARAVAVLEAPLAAAGLDVSRLHLRTFFTRGASAVIPGGGSHSTPRELVRWLVKLEQGRLVDPWSSLEMKRLLYFTRARYRYASSPALANSRVYFKSGSFYKCQPEPGYDCGKYRGNVTNLMHSVAIVESPGKGEQPERVYLVSMMSDVLRVNSAVEHQTIATYLERLLQGAR